MQIGHVEKVGHFVKKIRKSGWGLLPGHVVTRGYPCFYCHPVMDVLHCLFSLLLIVSEPPAFCSFKMSASSHILTSLPMRCFVPMRKVSPIQGKSILSSSNPWEPFLSLWKTLWHIPPSCSWLQHFQDPIPLNWEFCFFCHMLQCCHLPYPWQCPQWGGGVEAIWM